MLIFYYILVVLHLVIFCQDMMVLKPGKLQSHKIEELCLMLNCTSPCTNPLLERLRYPGSDLRERVSPFCLAIFADVSIFTRNFYPFPRGKPRSTRKRQTGTGVFCLLYVGRLNSKNQHLTQINNAHILVKVFNNLWRTSTAKVAIL